jgi:hypothetical protein
MTPSLAGPFRRLGLPATLLPEGGGPAVACRVVPVDGTEMLTLGTLTLTVARSVWHVRRAEVGTPTAGTLTLGGVGHTIRAGEPVAGDPLGLLWAITTDWGVDVTWTTPGSGDGGSSYDPPDEGLTYTARAAGAGATTLTIVCSGWSSGRVRADDGISVAGATYTATADVAQSLDGMAWVFLNVPITPALSGALSGGETVVFVPAGSSATRTVRAAIADYAASEIMGGVAAGDRRLIVRGGDMETAPTTADTVTLDGTDWSVTTVTALYVGAEVVAWDVQIRR